MSAIEIVGMVLEVIPRILSSFELLAAFVSLVSSKASYIAATYRWYGIRSVVLLLFGNREVWGIQARVLAKIEDEHATAFKKAVRDECTMISVAAAIVAQISVTALSFDKLSQTHWIAKALLLFTLVSSLMAVYYSTALQRTMGRLLSAASVRAWIRGTSYAQRWATDSPRWASRLNGQPCEPEEYSSSFGDYTPEFMFKYVRKNLIEEDVLKRCFTPSASCVMTVSAPPMLLSWSLFSLLAALGVHFGFMWTRDLDVGAGVDDSRNIFIVYAISLGVCFVVYSFSQLLSDGNQRGSYSALLSNTRDYVKRHPASAASIQILTFGHQLQTLQRTGLNQKPLDGETV